MPRSSSAIHPALLFHVASLALAATMWCARPAAAQRLSPPLVSGTDSAPAPAMAVVAPPGPIREPYAVRWWQAAAVLGAAGVVMADDRHVAHDTREHVSKTKDDLASAFRQAGDAKVYTAVTLGTLGAGLIAGSSGLTRTGGQLAASGALAAATYGLLKLSAGRSRPDAGKGPYDFHPFSGGGSFTSGHSATAFALATTLGDASCRTWVKVGLYVVATGTAWSRVYNERHWPSDVLLGAAVGVTSAKLVNGGWRVFGLHGPRFLVTPAGAGLQGRF